jgi:hypothetical protein
MRPLKLKHTDITVTDKILEKIRNDKLIYIGLYFRLNDIQRNIKQFVQPIRLDIWSTIK